MNINQLVEDTLIPLNIPVKFQKYTGVATTYITFFTYLNNNETYADNSETSIGHYLQIDIWSKSDYTDMVISAKNLLKLAGFRKTYETETYEDDTKIFHKVLRVFYLEQII